MHLESAPVKPMSQRLEERRHRACLTVRILSCPSILIRHAMWVVTARCVPYSGGRGTSLAWPNQNRPSRSAEQARAAAYVMIVLGDRWIPLLKLHYSLVFRVPEVDLRTV